MPEIGRSARPPGVAPSIVLINPRFSHNVGMVVRLASCFGYRQVWFTGDRVSMDLERRKRLPREERMKGYRSVEMVQHDRPLDLFPRDVTPVAVEVRSSSERLDQFEHPRNAVYVFGPEDGSVPPAVLNMCHRFVIIPTMNRYCLNLATAATAVMWDRAVKLGEVPGEDEMDGAPLTPVDTNPEELGLFSEPGWPK